MNDGMEKKTKEYEHSPSAKVLYRNHMVVVILYLDSSYSMCSVYTP